MASWTQRLLRRGPDREKKRTATGPATGEPARDRLWYPEPDTDFTDFSGHTPPSKLMFTLTGKCNLRCGHCARGLFKIDAQETPVELVDYVIEHLLPSLRALRLGGTDLGEQLVSRNLERFLEAVSRHPALELEIISNLSVLDDRRADLIARSCREFGVSLEGTGTFFELNRGFPWQRFLENLRRLGAARNRCARATPRIFALVTCYFDNLEELEPILDLRDEGVDLFRFRLFRPNHPSQAGQALESHRARANEVFDRLEARARRLGVTIETPPRFELPTLVEISKRARSAAARGEATPGSATESPGWICHFPFETASIFSDGVVSPCCESLFLGTLDRGKPDLAAMFRSGPWVELRRQVAERDFQGPCASCEFRRSRES